MTTPRSIVEDAERIAAFGMRSGQITDAEFYEAVSNAAAVGDEIKWSNSEMRALGAPLGTAVRTVGPDILVSLKTGWDPYAARAWYRRIRPVPGFCLVLTFVMIVVASYYTLWHARTTELLKFEFTKSLADQDEAVRRMLLPLLAATVQTPDASLDAVADPVVSASAASPATRPVEPDTARLGLLLEATDDVRQLHESIVRYEQRFANLYEQRIMWRKQARSVYLYLRYGPWFPAKPEAEVKDGLQNDEDPRETISDYVDPGVRTPANCDSGDQAAVINAFLGQRADVRTTAIALVNVRALRECLLDALGVTPSAKSNGYNSELHELEHMLTVVNNWLLPALYGALGALVYYMRQFLNPLRPNPGLAKVVMRVSLGALAGILIAWFQTTTSSGDALGITTLGLGSLMTAFIVGFSIDVFFNALERVVQWANAAIEKPSEGTRKPANG